MPYFCGKVKLKILLTVVLDRVDKWIFCLEFPLLFAPLVPSQCCPCFHSSPELRPVCTLSEFGQNDGKDLSLSQTLAHFGLRHREVKFFGTDFALAEIGPLLESPKSCQSKITQYLPI